MRERAKDHAYPYAYLKDGDSKVAGAYGARVTPHVFVVDGKGVVRYRGYVDDSAKPESREHAGLSDALDALLAKGEPKVTAVTSGFQPSFSDSEAVRPFRAANPPRYGDGQPNSCTARAPHC